MTQRGPNAVFMLAAFCAALILIVPAAAGEPLSGSQEAASQGPAAKPQKAETNPAPYFLPSIPPQMTLAGEKVPLNLPFVAEQLDREFTIAVHDRAQVVMWLKRARRYFPYISQELKKAGMPDDLKYLAVAESSLLHRVRSVAGASGLWQFIPETGKRYTLRVDQWFDDRRNPLKATGAALAYLRDLHEEFGSWALAMAAYNCGERRVREEIAEQGIKDYYHLYLPRETMRYVFRIMAAKIILADPAKYGYVLPAEELYAPVESDSLDLRLGRELHLRLLAQACNTTVRELMEMNPELRSYWLPRGSVSLLVPKGEGAKAKERLASLEKTAKPQGVSSRPPRDRQTVVVKPGDTLGAIAKRYKVKVKDLVRANKISGTMIRPGQRLAIP
ncbi:hypothetical protein AAU61_01730 [Desulfocarbo indianensis]|nr:hypothetical protein AAU61_01730 [Desulfocarbo indianensis]